jgi:hypothetical protein
MSDRRENWSRREFVSVLTLAGTAGLLGLCTDPAGNPEETVRFWALRLREVGFITSGPQTLIGRGTDWRFLNELKKELKG